MGRRVTIVEAAAGAADGTLTFSRHPRYRMLSSAGGTVVGRTVEDGYTVTTVPVERVDAKVTGKVRLVKVDVEGGEAAALSGLRGVNPEFLDVEVYRDNAHDWDHLVAELERLSGTPHTINEDGTLTSVPLRQVIDKGCWPHVVFA